MSNFRKAGIPASMSTANVEGNKAWHRVFIAGFGTYEDAKRYAEDVLATRNIKNYWIRLAE